MSEKKTALEQLKENYRTNHKVLGVQFEVLMQQAFAELAERVEALESTILELAERVQLLEQAQAALEATQPEKVLSVLSHMIGAARQLETVMNKTDPHHNCCYCDTCSDDARTIELAERVEALEGMSNQYTHEHYKDTIFHVVNNPAQLQKQIDDWRQHTANDARTIELPDSEFDALLKLDTFKRLFVLYGDEAIKVGFTTFIRAKKESK